MSFSALSRVEVQLIAQCLSEEEIVTLARCNRRLYSDIDSPFVFKNIRSLCIHEDNCVELTSRSLIRHTGNLRVYGELSLFTALPDEVRRATKRLDLGNPDCMERPPHLSGEMLQVLKEVLGKYRGLTGLDLSSRLNTKGFDIIASALPSNIKEIRFDNCRIASIEPLTDRMRNGKLQLLSLSLNHCQLDSESLSHLFRALITDRSLRILEVMRNSIFEEEARILGEALRVNTSLEELNISYCGLGDNVVEIAEALRYNESGSALTFLCLEGNSISDIGATALAKMYGLSGSRNFISSISLAYNLIGSGGAIAIVKALSKSSLILDIDFTDNGISAEGSARIADAINEISTELTIKSLVLDSNSFDDRFMEGIGEALIKNCSIETLSFDNTAWCESNNATRIADALHVNRTLTSLSISRIVLQSSMREISSAIKVNTTLVSLDLSLSRIDDDGALFLAEALSVNKTLQTLDIPSNEIGDKGAIAIGEALRQNCSLTELVISGNQFSDRGAGAIATALDRRCSVSRLQHLDISGNRLTNLTSEIGEIFVSGSLIASLSNLNLYNCFREGVSGEMIQVQRELKGRCEISY